MLAQYSRIPRNLLRALPRSVSTATKSDAELIASILDHSLPYVATTGWGPTTLARGASSAGYPPALHSMVFKEGELGPGSGGGEAALVNHHMETSLDELKAALDPVPSSFKDLRDSERIAQAIRMRLTMNAKFIETNRWHEAMATGALPSNVLKTAQYLNDTLDVILGTAKTAEVTTLGKYGARAAVGGVYLSTELFMLTDESEGFRDTWEYLGRRMNEIERAGEGLGRGELADVAVASGAAAAAIGGAVVSLAGPTAVRAFGEIGMGLSKFGLSSVLGGLGGAAKNEARTEDSFYESNNADDGGWVLDTEDEGKEKLNADALFPK